MSETYSLKFICIGNSGAGKTSILKRLVDNKFVKGNQSTVGIEYFTYGTTIDGRTVKLLIWDTAGQERFYTIAKAYFRSALGVVLVFDICDRKSFDQLPRWLRDARMEADPNCVVLLVGNKSDLKDQRVVSYEEAEQFAKQQDLNYIETSALENTNIQEVFTRIGSEILRRIAAGKIQTSAVSGQNTGGGFTLSQSQTKEDDGCKC